MKIKGGTMTVEHLIEVLKKFDGKEKIFIKTNRWNGSDYTEVDASMGVNIENEDIGVVIEVDL